MCRMCKTRDLSPEEADRLHAIQKRNRDATVRLLSRPVEHDVLDQPIPERVSYERYYSLLQAALAVRRERDVAVHNNRKLQELIDELRERQAA